MEARRFGFKEPSVNKFDPTDEDIVAYYLLPRATGVPNEYEHAVIDDDPCSCPPWELLRRHRHGDSDHAFFFGPPRDMARNAGGRVRRVVSPAAPGGVGGVWRGQKSVDKEVVIVRGHAGGAELTIKFRRYNLTYYRKGEQSSSGWVMHEYHVVHPVLRPGAVVARIKITERGKKRGNRQRLMQEEAAVIARAAAAAVAPGPDQPGPSNYFVVSESDYYGHAAGNAAVVAGVDGEGTSSGGAHQSSVAVVQHGDDGYNGGGVCLGKMIGGYNYTDFLNAVVDGSINYIGGEDPPVLGNLHDAGNAVALSDDGAGTNGHAQPGSQIVHQHGGVVGDTTNGYYVDHDGKVYLTMEDISHYFNQDLIGSTGDHFTTELNKSIYEPANASDTPAATEVEDIKERRKAPRT